MKLNGLACFYIGLFYCFLIFYVISKNTNILNRYLFKHLSIEKDSDSNFHNHKSQACIYPNMSQLNDFDDTSVKVDELVNCEADEDWVYTANGRFYIHLSAEKKYGVINCTYIPIVNSGDAISFLKPIYPMPNESILISDAFEVSCQSENGKRYSNIHACIARTNISGTKKQTSSNSDTFNVLMIGLDSLSRPMFQRLLPKTHEFFTQRLGGKLLEGYSIVGDGTTQALMPLLTGKRETEIPEVRRGWPGAKTVDQVLEFVWKRYEKKSYITQWAEDRPDIGTFHYRLLGFSNKPVTHYMRSFYLEAERFEKTRYCIGSRSSYEVYLDWLKEGIETNKRTPFFTIGFISNYTHSEYSQVALTDKHNLNFLKYLWEKKVLDSTFLITMSDHGLRHGPFRMTEQGKLEERMPYFGVYVPPKFRSKYAKKYHYFIENTKRLIVPSDIHETLLEIIGERSDHSQINRTVYSLFSSIPEERTCLDAGIEAHWCICKNSEMVSVSGSNVTRCVQKVVSHINGILNEHTALCQRLFLKRVLKAVSFKTGDGVLKFKESLDNDGRVPDLSDTLSSKSVQYQITLETSPNSAIFEATLTMNMETGDIKINKEDISRLNRYNDAAKCIENIRPDISPYCYCRR